MLKSVVVSLLLVSGSAKAAVYKESGGVVVVDAKDFDYRNFEFTDAAIPHHFHIVPDEDGLNTPEHPWADTGNNPNDPNGQNKFANSRSGHYVQIVPDDPNNQQNKGNCPTCPNENVGFPPYVEYKLNINTLGIVWNRTPGNYENISQVLSAMEVINADGSASLFK